MPFAFNAVELYVAAVNGKHWTHAKEVCKALEYQRRKYKTKDVLKKHVSIENKQHQHQLKAWITATQPLNWQKNSQPSEYYLNEEGMYEVLFRSQQPLAKKLRKHCCNVMFPHIRKQLINKMVEEHQIAIRERENVIEQKDAAIALLNDDLDDAGKQGTWRKRSRISWQTTLMLILLSWQKLLMLSFTTIFWENEAVLSWTKSVLDILG